MRLGAFSISHNNFKTVSNVEKNISNISTGDRFLMGSTKEEKK